MAKIQIKIGPLSAEVTTSDETAVILVTDYLRAYELWDENATNEQQLQTFVRHLANHVKMASNSIAIKKALDAQKDKLLTERKLLNWD